MWVEPDLLHSGADMTRKAGERALSGAETLADAWLLRGMFGDFGDAHAFHGRVKNHHGEQVAVMHQHHQVLTNIADKAHVAANGFTSVDKDNAAGIRSVAPRAL
jgi:hypothetical protein